MQVEKRFVPFEAKPASRHGKGFRLENLHERRENKNLVEREASDRANAWKAQRARRRKSVPVSLAPVKALS